VAQVHKPQVRDTEHQNHAPVPPTSEYINYDYRNDGRSSVKYSDMGSDVRPEERDTTTLRVVNIIAFVVLIAALVVYFA
jgi:hypothetical protein